MNCNLFFVFNMVENNKKLENAEKNKELCKDCTLCCDSITVELRQPKGKEDFERMIWLILHENISIYQDPEGKWNLEVSTKCKALNKEGLCNMYSERPDICSDYDQKGCDRYSGKPYYIQMFRTREDILEYIKKTFE